MKNEIDFFISHSSETKHRLLSQENTCIIDVFRAGRQFLFAHPSKLPCIHGIINS